MIDIPTALTKKESEALTRISEGKLVLELGALLGYSTITLANSAKRVFSVDPHEGYPVDNPRSTLLPFFNNLERYGVIDKVVPIISKYELIVDSLPEVDVAFIDLMGYYNQTLDALMAAPVKMGGWYAVHDYQRKHPFDCSGATQAVNDFVRMWEYNTEQVDTLLLIERKVI